jgi:hypothetical protein
VSSNDGPSFSANGAALSRALFRIGMFATANVALVARGSSLSLVDASPARTVEITVDARVQREGAIAFKRVAAMRALNGVEDEVLIDASRGDLGALLGGAKIIEPSSVAAVTDVGAAVELTGRALEQMGERASLRVAFDDATERASPRWCSLDREGDGSLALSAGGYGLVRARVEAGFVDGSPSPPPVRCALDNAAPRWIQAAVTDERGAVVRVTISEERAVVRARNVAIALHRIVADGLPIDGRARIDAILAQTPRKPIFFEPRAMRAAIEKVVRGTQVETITFARARGGRLLVHSSRRDGLVAVGGEPPEDPVRFDRNALLVSLVAVDDELEAELLLGSPVDSAVFRSGGLELVIGPRPPA